MNRTTLNYIFHANPPWISLGRGEPERHAWIPSQFYSREYFSACVRLLRGHKMRTKQALMDEFAAALQFFIGFGENWDALEECLRYLDEWLPADGYLIVVEKSEELLGDESLGDMVTLLQVLHAAGESWAQPIADGDRFDRPSIPFHVLLHVTTGAAGADNDIARAAYEAGVPLRKLH